MSTNKILLAALAGGVVSFLAGWLLYGMLFASFMAANSTNPSERAEMMMLPMFLSCLVSSLALALIFGRWASISTLKTGAIAGGILWLLYALAFDLSMYSTTTILSITAVIVDPIIYAVMGALTGAAVAWVLGYKK